MRENPFPGMNPYMEDPLYWRGHHALLIAAINIQLNQVLPLEYSTRVEERVYVENWQQEYIPDSAIVLTRPLEPDENRGGIAVLERPQASIVDAPLVLEWEPRTIRETFVEIRSRNENEDLITVIEVLSPTNKEPGPGRDEYRAKQADLVSSWVHLLEIDLLRSGQYSLAPNETRLRQMKTRFDYMASLHRGGRGTAYECWPIALRDKLPRVTVPLAVKGDFVALDLQEVVNRVYTENGVWRYVRYNDAPNPPLRAEDEKWADALLREKGLRP